jgi:hypothetical protein
MECRISFIENLQNIKKLNFCITFICESKSIYHAIDSTDIIVRFIKTKDDKYNINLSAKYKQSDDKLHLLADLSLSDDIVGFIESFLLNNNDDENYIITSIVSQHETEKNHIGYISFGINYTTSTPPNSILSNVSHTEPSKWMIMDGSQSLHLSCSKCGSQISSLDRQINSLRALPTGLFDSVRVYVLLH